MARSKGTIVSVKIPMKWESMTKRQQTRLSRITSRDTRVIRAYLGVIARHEKHLLVGKRKKRIDAGRLDRLTLTSLRSRDASKRRPTVLHDFKAKFHNISQNELQECRDMAIGMWSSYLERGGSTPLKSSNNHPKKIPRNIFPGRFQLVHRPDLKIKYWLEIRNSLDSNRLGRTIHDKLTIPLKAAPFHLSKIGRGMVKSCRIVKDTNRKWWVIFAVNVDTDKVNSCSMQGKQFAVMGIDLGISKAACAVVLTRDSIARTKYFHQPEKKKHLAGIEKRIASLQREMRLRENTGSPRDKVIKKLRELSHKRATINEEWDRVLVREMMDFAIELISHYDLYVAIGNPKGIRNIARREYSRSRKYRGMIHHWAFSRIILNLKHGFAQLGWTTGKLGSRFLAVYEGRTSITCHKCGRKGIRPKQNLFVCHTCGCRTNADKNGAINIARRMIRLTPELRDEHRGLGRWLFPRERKPFPKAARRSLRISKRKSQLPQRSPVLPEGESAVVRLVQTDLLNFGDEAGSGDEDPAVEKTAEIPSATECLDSPRSDALGVEWQRKEATSQERSHAPMTLDNARAILECVNTTEVSDDSRELGRTQKLQVSGGVHSHSRGRFHQP